MTIRQALKHHKLVLLILLILLVVAGIFIHGLRSPSSQQLTYGVALDLGSLDQAHRIKELSQIKNMGFTEVRFDLNWSTVQPRNGNTYTWTTTDAVMQEVKNSGLTSIVTLDRTPGWARPANCRHSIFCAPSRPSDFAKFASAVVKRYQGYGVSAWEIWNEPNIINFWKPAPNPYEYTQLLKASYLAIKQQDPNATVLVGGLSGNAYNINSSYIDARTFLNQLYSDNAKDYFNGVAYHPYTSLRLPQDVTPYNGWPKMYKTNPSLRSIMVAHGDQSKDIWLTEFGVPTNGPGTEVSNPAGQLPPKADHVSLAAQAQIARETLKEAKDIKWIKNFDWYTYMDFSTKISTSESFYGLLQYNGNPKPAYFVLQDALK
jgi:hypothetical protein